MHAPAVEITYGLERILMALQGVSNFKDIRCVQMYVRICVYVCACVLASVGHAHAHAIWLRQGADKASVLSHTASVGNICLCM